MDILHGMQCVPYHFPQVRLFPPEGNGVETNCLVLWNPLHSSTCLAIYQIRVSIQRLRLRHRQYCPSSQENPLLPLTNVK